MLCQHYGQTISLGSWASGVSLESLQRRWALSHCYVVKFSVCVAEGHLGVLFQQMQCHGSVCVSEVVVPSQGEHNSDVILLWNAQLGSANTHTYPDCCLSPEPLFSWTSQDCISSWPTSLRTWKTEIALLCNVCDRGVTAMEAWGRTGCKSQWKRLKYSAWDLRGPASVSHNILGEKM